MNTCARLLLPAVLCASLPAQDAEPAPSAGRWLEYEPAAGPGDGQHVVLVAADQEYRSEQALPMLARILAKHHGFRCTVLFAVNDDGLVDPTLPTRPQDPDAVHTIPGFAKLQDADLLILFTRFVTLPEDDLQHLIDYLESGKPLIGIRTANHGFRGPFPYEKDGEPVRFGVDVLGGTFRGHHGAWHRESTRGVLVDEQRDHPILRGVADLWGPSDVYRTHAEDAGLPDDCTALVLGQPLTGREPDDPPNTDKEALPIAWTHTWTGNAEHTARVFHVTMGSARDYQCADLRRMTVNAAYWCLGLEDAIDPERSVDHVGSYDPLPSGFDYEKLGVKPRPVSHYR